MQFTGLKIAGFKSFVDPVDVPIHEGLTGIVGPNGCGKSNILESLRWVMGATSARAMRGGEMDDLIFSGSADRAARESAEVALVLDNTARTAPAELNNEDELEVRRRIRRGAGSTYKINGRTVRAKDVQLLFADASTGANSPALVRQGQISELIASKPQNRRRILEEAAGIAGLNARRHEAELKLRAASDNLERLNEIIGEVEKQLGSLKRQAAKARKYKALQNEIDGLEAFVLAHKWRTAIDDRKTAEAELEQARISAQDSTQSSAGLNARVAEAQSKIQPLRDKEAEAAGKLGALRLEIARLDGEKSAVKDALKRLEADLTRVVEDMSREHDLREEAAEAAKRLTTQLANLPSENTDALAAQEFELQTCWNDAKQDLVSAESKAEQLSLIVATAQAEAKSAARQIESAESRLASISKRLEQNQESLSELGDEDTLISALEDAKSALASAEKAHEDAQASVDAKTSTANDAEGAVDQSRSPLSKAENELAALNSEITALERLVTQFQPDDHRLEPVLSKVKPTKGYERALGAVLGDDLNAPVDDTASQFWTKASVSADQKLPKGVEVLSNKVKAPAILGNRLDQCGVVETVEDGDRLQSKLKPGQRLVTLDGHMWRWDGFVRTPEAPTSTVAILEHRAKLDACKDQLPTLNAKLDAANSVFETAQKALTAAKVELDTVKQAVTPASRAVMVAREDVLEAKQNLERFKIQSEAIQSSLDRHQLEKDEAESALQTAQSQAVKTTNENNEANLIAARNDVAKARDAERTTLNVLNDFKRSRDQSKARRIAITKEQADWARRAEKADTRSTELLGQRSRIRSELDATKEKPEKLETLSSELNDQASQAETERKSAADSVSEAETELRTAESDLRRAQEESTRAREVLARSETRLESAQQRENDAEAVAHAQFDRDLDALTSLALAALGFEEEDPPLDLKEAETRLAVIKRERDQLGGVNLEADDQVVETADRLEAQLREREDLDLAIDKLREGVDALNNEGRKRLLVAFEEVAEHFKTLFETLFEGGEAYLKLTESDDPLDAGLEIFASPPGKKLGTLSLMSGGEQALTAAALIFAVFLSRPSPLCVLDEVDAPLDDANVDRFCRMLDEMRKRTDTRFVVITHNPVTMSRMDRLFGVTMQERGVSRLVSVDLQAAEQLVAAQ